MIVASPSSLWKVSTVCLSRDRFDGESKRGCRRTWRRAWRCRALQTGRVLLIMSVIPPSAFASLPKRCPGPSTRLSCPPLPTSISLERPCTDGKGIHGLPSALYCAICGWPCVYMCAVDLYSRSLDSSLLGCLSLVSVRDAQYDRQPVACRCTRDRMTIISCMRERPRAGARVCVRARPMLQTVVVAQTNTREKICWQDARNQK